MNLGGDDSFENFEPYSGSTEEFKIVTLEAENIELKQLLEEKTKESELNRDALHMLIGICKEKGFDPFPGEDFPFKKAVKDLSRVELIAKNKVAAEHIQKTRGVDSKEKIQMPPAHVLEAKYTTETPTLDESMEELLKKLPPPEPSQTVHPFERKVIFASSEDPYDPYSGDRR
jgi:hypothetical protein